MKAHALRLVLRFGLVLLLSAPPRLVHAEKAVDAKASDQVPGSLLSDLDTATFLGRGQETERELETLLGRGSLPDAVHQIALMLGRRAGRIEHDAVTDLESIGKTSRWTSLSDLRFRYVGLDLELARYRAPLVRASSLVAKVESRATAVRDEWRRASAALEARGAPSELLAQAKRIEDKATQVLDQTNRSAAELARATAQLDVLDRTVQDVLEAAEENAPGILTDFWNKGLNPGQAVQALGRQEPLGKALGRGVRHNADALEGFFRTYPGRLFWNVVFWLGATYAFLRIRAAQIRATEAMSGTPSASGERRSMLDLIFAPRSSGAPLPIHVVYRHPYAAGALSATIGAAVIYPVMPAAGALFALSVAVVSSAIIVISEGREGLFELGTVSLGLLCMAVLHLMFAELPAITTLLLGPEALVVAFIAYRTVKRPAIALSGVWGAAKNLLGRIWLVAVGVGGVAWGLGYEVPAVVFIDGTARMVLLTIAFQAGYSVLVALVEAFADSSMALRSRAIVQHRRLLVGRARSLLQAVLLFLWLSAALESYTVRRAAIAAGHRALDAPIELGSLTFTLADILTLAFGVFLAVVVARLLRFTLDQEVLPRTSLRIGTSAAISAGSYFIAISAGIFLAIAAAGLKLDKLAIVVSALGVGIGFGLQNIVQNFVAGLILLFSRPINVQDTVQVRDLMGRVTKVGARASTIRTFQGAEVIVPNSTFISEQVINWSLSDETRRVELDVGVAYGTAPERVVELLLDVAKAHPDVLAEPPAEAIFIGFGDSSLNFQLRVWTAHGSLWLNLRSDLGIAANHALAQANIEIPFPQRDLHIRTTPHGANWDGSARPVERPE